MTKEIEKTENTAPIDSATPVEDVVQSETVVDAVAQVEPVVTPVEPTAPEVSTTPAADVATVATGNVAVAHEREQRVVRGARGGQAQRGGKGGRGGGRPRPVREKPEFESKTISIRRVTRVVSGGRRFTLSVALVAGDRNGRIGLGTGKALDTQVAIEKALKAAKRNMITIKLSKQKSLSHDIEAKFKSSSVMIMPNRSRGLIAGSSARTILSLAGLNDVTAKFYSGTKNKLNNARATMKALEQIAYAHGEAPVQAVKVGAETPVVEAVVPVTK
ncbi:30S ribosomal protein S5 [Candidatus Gracilibacteria bacterium]|nr:30S ribosomal protein S5 [Candidatus Gracilibacteria bacterium]MCF7898460.1 30S ribosomal protein S5 [Candidatus Paceibacterota bacterium]